MTFSRHSAMAQSQANHPVRILGYQHGKKGAGWSCKYPHGSRNWYQYRDGYNTGRGEWQAQERAKIAAQYPATPPVPAPAATPAPQRQRSQPATRQLGGKPTQSLAKLAGIFCSQKAFQAWCGAASEEEAAQWVRATCGVTSRADLDTNADAAELFHARVRRPYAAIRES